MTDATAQSSPLSQAIMAGVIAVLATGGAVWIGWMLGWPWIFDVNDPDFNPMLLAVGVLIAVALRHAVSALKWYSRHRSFG
ncbi:MAG: hypothetical protein C0524_06625 [Rhodobacter sp.]|nr:hypothetical protein [Rhodobacter sp.]